MKVLIAPDKFRGSLSALQVIEALTSGIQSIDSHVEIDSATLADGGEGSLEIISKAYNCSSHKIRIKNAIGEPIESIIGWNEQSKIAVLEMASYVGLNQLNEVDRNPCLTSSYGLGMALKEGIHLGAKKVIIGIGGSATNDGGAGMLEALGYHFINENGGEFSPNGGNLNLISQIIIPKNTIHEEVEIVVASDVQNPITGPNGATMVYAEQKGASKKDLNKLETNMIHYARLMEEFTQKEVFDVLGFGAAGGVPLSACNILNAKLISGSQLLFELLHLEDRIKDADLIITGEGKIDSQTLFGKAITPIVETSLKFDKELRLICGVFDAKKDEKLSKVPRYELSTLAQESGMDSFRNAYELCQLVGQKVAEEIAD